MSTKFHSLPRNATGTCTVSNSFVGFGNTLTPLLKSVSNPTLFTVLHSEVSEPQTLLATTAYTPFTDAVNVVPVAPAIGVKSEQLIHCKFAFACASTVMVTPFVKVITGVIGENSMFKFKVMVESHPLAFVITCVYVPDCV